MLRAFVYPSFSGIIGVSLMDLLSNFPGYYLLEDEKTVQAEKKVHIYNRWAPEAAATLLALKILSFKLNNKQSLFFGRLIHFGMGVLSANVYAILLRHSVILKKSKGFPFLLSLIIFDELATYKMGFAAKPKEYPLQAHIRGCISNSIQGLAIHNLLISKHWFLPQNQLP